MQDFSGDTFLEMAVVLGLATVLGIVGQKLKQPLLIMFLVTGVLVGPAGLGVLSSHDEVELLAHMGIALLLFIVGMRLDLELVRTTGLVALLTGIGQIVFTSVIGFGLALAMGMEMLTAAYVAVALTFSSTIIIVKLLSDKREIDSLHGRIAVGFLIVQDIAAIGALVLLTTLTTVGGDASTGTALLEIVLKGVLLFAGVAITARYLLRPVLDLLAQSQELLVLFAIAWAVALGALSDILGFSKEVGAFLAGIAIASTPYREAIGARLTNMRDFLLLFFFIDLGARLEWSTAGPQIPHAIILSVFVLVGNPIIVLALMGWMGYRRRTGFFAGLTVAQISEFSLIVAALGVGLGHIPAEAMGLITLVGVMTIFLSTYMILYAENLYRPLAGLLGIFERRDPVRERRADVSPNDGTLDVILIGAGDYGTNLASGLVATEKKIMIVDFDPAALDRWRQRGVPVLYGDIGDPELYEALPLGRARWVVSTVRNVDINRFVVEQCRARGFDGRFAMTAALPEERAVYEAAKVDVVLQPWLDAAQSAAGTLDRAMDVIPIGLEWPVAFREIHVEPFAFAAGKTIEELALFRQTGMTVLAVGRAGRVEYDPRRDFRIFPGDRILIMGPPDRLQEAEERIRLQEEREKAAENKGGRFEATEVLVPPDSKPVGRSLSQLRFRETHGVSVVGMARGAQRLTPDPHDPLQARDILVVIGPHEAIERFRRQPWL